MKTLRLITALGLGGLMAACGAAPDITSRNAPFEAAQLETGQPKLAFQQEGTAPTPAAALPQALNVADITIRVPQTLTVSEANGYYPRADIVWRGDNLGNRHQQVKAIFENAFAEGTRGMNSGKPVTLDVQLVRFHSLTERARERVGGVHNMEFFLTVYDAETGTALIPPRRVEANLPALGGVAAIEAVQRGQTQKVRVSTYLSMVIQQELRKRPV